MQPLHADAVDLLLGPDRQDISITCWTAGTQQQLHSSMAHSSKCRQ